MYQYQNQFIETLVIYVSEFSLNNHEDRICTVSKINYIQNFYRQN